MEAVGIETGFLHVILDDEILMKVPKRIRNMPGSQFLSKNIYSNVVLILSKDAVHT